MDNWFIGWLDTVTLKDLVYFIVGVIAVISIVVEKAKNIPFHPWTHLLEYLGGMLTKGIDSRLDQIDMQQRANNEAIKELDRKVEMRFNEQQREEDEKEAKRLRSHIIEFADSCRVHQKHTKTAFENITRDYDDYINYCEKHNIPNHFIDAEFEYIKGVYAECQEENKFL